MPRCSGCRRWASPKRIPSLDVDGWDAAAKTAALANVLMRARMTPQAVEREGIGPATARLAMAAKARGARVRLVASARTTPAGRA